MALKSIPALIQAVKTALSEAGNTEEHKALSAALTDLQKIIHSGAAEEANPAEKEPDNDADDYSFEAAQKRHTERAAARTAESAGTGHDGGEGK